MVREPPVKQQLIRDSQQEQYEELQRPDSGSDGKQDDSSQFYDNSEVPKDVHLESGMANMSAQNRQAVMEYIRDQEARMNATGELLNRRPTSQM